MRALQSRLHHLGSLGFYSLGNQVVKAINNFHATIMIELLFQYVTLRSCFFGQLVLQFSMRYIVCDAQLELGAQNDTVILWQKIPTVSFYTFLLQASVQNTIA